jgi:hypothetical protein
MFIDHGLIIINLEQGDQMSLRKNNPKCSQTHFYAKLLRTFISGKKVYIGHFGKFQNICPK